MSASSKKMGLHATAGVLMAFLIIAIMGISSLTIPDLRFPGFTPLSPVPNTGTLLVMLTDAPVNLTHLNVILDSISAQREEYDDQTWINLTFVNNKEEVYFNLLALQDVAMNLSLTEIPPGNYTAIRMHIKTANATYVDGTTTDLDVPNKHIKITIRFEIVNGEETTVLVDMQADWVAISQNNELRPVLKATVLP